MTSGGAVLSAPLIRSKHPEQCGEFVMRDNDGRAVGVMERLGAASGVIWYLLIMVSNQMSTAGTR